MPTKTNNNKSIYNSLYKKIGGYYNLRESKIMIDLIGVERGSGLKLLDIACGDGLLLKLAHLRNGKHLYYGCDLSDYMIEKVKSQLPFAKFSIQDAQSLTYRDNSFDMVTNLGSLEHFNDPDQAIAEMARILKKGGRGCVYTPNVFYIRYIIIGLLTGRLPIHDGTGQEDLLLGPTNWVNKIRAAGLTVIKMQGFSPYSNIIQKIILSLLPRYLKYGYFFVFTK
jgi:SAM-dependent methyltransferase